MSILKSLICVAVFGSALLMASPAVAEEKVFDNCSVVKVEDQRLWVKSPSGDEHSAEVAKDATITIDGKPVSLTQLKSGVTIKLTVRKDEGSVVILKVEARTKS